MSIIKYQDQRITKLNKSTESIIVSLIIMILNIPCFFKFYFNIFQNITFYRNLSLFNTFDIFCFAFMN